MTKRLNRVGLTIIAFIGLLCMIFLGCFGSIKVRY